MLYEKVAFAIVALAAASTVAIGARDWNTEEREPFHYEFSKDKTLDVDNVNGLIQVTGDGGGTIRVEGEKVIHARDRQAVDRAKQDVKLDVNESDGVAQLYANGPFRGNDRSSDYHGFHFHFDPRDYEVDYNFNIHVPRDTTLRLRTVNGEVKTGQTRGNFDVSGVNGSVSMAAVAGSGRVSMVNGRMEIAFRESPKADTEFHSVNGAIEATFPPNLAADLLLHTLNGQAYTDFDSTPLAGGGLAQTENGRRNGRFVYKPDRRTRLRIGAGGPELRFDTVNGDIKIKKGNS